MTNSLRKTSHSILEGVAIEVASEEELNKVLKENKLHLVLTSLDKPEDLNHKLLEVALLLKEAKEVL